MSDDELLKSLDTYACQLREVNAQLIYAAKARIEALRGEVERLKEERDAAITDRFDAAAERIKAVTAERDRLAGEVETAKSQFKALQMVTSKEHEDTRAERDRLKAALETIAHDNVPREVFIVWRTDGSNSKHDKCQHMRMMYEDCGNCTALFARKALGDAS